MKDPSSRKAHVTDPNPRFATCLSTTWVPRQTPEQQPHLRSQENTEKSSQIPRHSVISSALPNTALHILQEVFSPTKCPRVRARRARSPRASTSRRYVMAIQGAVAPGVSPIHLFVVLALCLLVLPKGFSVCLRFCLALPDNCCFSSSFIKAKSPFKKSYATRFVHSRAIGYIYYESQRLSILVTNTSTSGPPSQRPPPPIPLHNQPH